MNDFLSLALTLVVGVVLGAVFFGGLWWTVRQAMPSRWVAVWFIGSLLLRTTIVLAGFSLACGSRWQNWLVALLGFTMARFLVTRLTLPAKGVATSLTGGRNAP